MPTKKREREGGASVQKHLSSGFGNITRGIEIGGMSLSFSYIGLVLEYCTLSLDELAD